MTMIDLKPMVLPADVYDALELSCEAAGGIGADMLCSEDYLTPHCLMGHAMFLESGLPTLRSSGDVCNVIADAAERAGADPGFGWVGAVVRNNAAIHSLGIGHRSDKRVSWQQFVRAAKIVREASQANAAP